MPERTGRQMFRLLLHHRCQAQVHLAAGPGQESRYREKVALLVGRPVDCLTSQDWSVKTAGAVIFGVGMGNDFVAQQQAKHGKRQTC